MSLGKKDTQISVSPPTISVPRPRAATWVASLGFVEVASLVTRSIQDFRRVTDPRLGSALPQEGAIAATFLIIAGVLGVGIVLMFAGRRGLVAIGLALTVVPAAWLIAVGARVPQTLAGLVPPLICGVLLMRPSVKRWTRWKRSTVR